jgi:hypothetical protein
VLEAILQKIADERWLPCEGQRWFSQPHAVN